MSERSAMFGEEALLVSVSLPLGLIIDLLFDLNISEIVLQLPLKAMNAPHGGD